jgi:hypothetical protein
VPENTAISILTAAPTHNRSIDLLLSIIKANIDTPLPTHTIDINCKKMLADLALQGKFIQSYQYYFGYSDLIKYYLQFPSSLIKSVLIELTNNSNEVTGTDVDFLITKYNEIKSSIFDNSNDLCIAFTNKVNSFYISKDIEFVNEDNLSYIIIFITDNYLSDCNLVNGIILQSNSFINNQPENVWINALKEWETSKIIELFKTLEKLNKFNNDKLPLASYTAYSDVIKSISKKEIAIPSDIDFWNKILSFSNGNFINIYKNVRDELLNYNHPEVTMDELLFFEKGLFQYGKLDEDQKTADDVLRRILISLATNDATYINVLKRNAVTIHKIIEKANDLIIDFKTTLESKSPEIFNDAEIKIFADLLFEKSQILYEDMTKNKNEEPVAQES